MSTALRITALDPHDPASFDPWWEAYRDAEQHDRGEVATVWQRDELRALMQAPGRARAVAGWSGAVGEETVTTGYLSLPQLDNLTRASVAVTTTAPHRRRGHGTAMLEHLLAQVRAAGRITVDTETFWPHDAGPDGAGAPGREFARRHGFELALGDVHRRLTLPVADDLLDRLAGEAANRHAGYTLRSFTGPVPDELLAGVAELDALVATDAPTGTLDVEPHAVDLAAFRDAEGLLERQGRTKVATVALDPAGEVVAFTDLATTVHEPDRAYQWGTLVRRDHRGHRLGLAVKVANLRLLQREFPAIRQLTTFNAESNVHMVAVNDALGFEPVERLGEFQLRLS